MLCSPSVPACARASGTDGYQQSYDGVLVGADRRRDLAVVKVNAPPEALRPVQLGASSSLRVGQLCLAIGNPFGFDHTLTTGPAPRPASLSPPPPPPSPVLSLPPIPSPKSRRAAFIKSDLTSKSGNAVLDSLQLLKVRCCFIRHRTLGAAQRYSFFTMSSIGS